MGGGLGGPELPNPDASSDSGGRWTAFLQYRFECLGVELGLLSAEIADLGFKRKLAKDDLCCMAMWDGREKMGLRFNTLPTDGNDNIPNPKA